MKPTISVIAQPAHEIGAEAASLLIKRIRGEAPLHPQSITLDTKLTVRGSPHRNRMGAKRGRQHGPGSLDE